MTSTESSASDTEAKATNADPSSSDTSSSHSSSSHSNSSDTSSSDSNSSDSDSSDSSSSDSGGSDTESIVDSESSDSSDTDSSDEDSYDIEQGRPAQPAQPVAPVAPGQQASSSWWMATDWTDEEQEKVRSARALVVGGVAKLGAGLGGIATSVGLGLRADSTQDDDSQDHEAQLSGWWLLGGASVAAGFALAGVIDIYNGIKNWTAQIRAHQARLAAGAPHLAQVIVRLDQHDDGNARLGQFHGRLQDEGGRLNGGGGGDNV